jgi:tetratricopeptide (TPR) repeat protein
MFKYLSLVLGLCPFVAWGADGYIAAHASQHPEVVKKFIECLPSRESLVWQAWWHLQKQDYEQANKCYTALAELDDPQGYRGLADSYLAGHGLAQSTELALMFYEKAGELGLGPAQINAAVLYADQRKWDAAERWFKKALHNPDLSDMKDELTRLYNKRMSERS